MKKNYTLIIATILLLLTGFAPQTWAVEYVLNTNPNVNINKSSNEFTLSCPGETLTFDLALAGGATGSVTVEEYDKDGNATTILNAANAGTFLCALRRRAIKARCFTSMCSMWWAHRPTTLKGKAFANN